VRRSALRLYAPFIALALAQAAFVVWAPSKGEQTVNAFADPTAAGSSFTTTPGGGAAVPSGASGATGTTPGSGGSVAAGGAPGATGGGGGAGGGGGSNAAATEGGAPAGDTSHCKGDRQTDVIYNSPPCAPAFAGDNGGATYPGVTAEEIRVVIFQCQSNEQVDAILMTQGLASTDEETDAMIDADIRFINEFYETYGRKVVAERVRGDCPTTPPDPAKARQAAAEVAKTQPAFVYVAGGGSAAADVFAQAGIMSVGVQWNGEAFYAGRRPFRWDIFPTSTETSQWMGEYYCKKMAGKPASNAGQLIHPSIGSRTTTRKLGIIVPDDGTGTILPAAQEVSRLVKECSGVDTPVFTYQSDINRATEQTRVTVAGLIDAKVTTVTCMCDPIAPVFLTKGMTQNNYYPEHMVSGMGLIDYDVLGRLYDPAQWTHAFGMSQLVEPVPFEQTDAAKIWRAVGNEGNPCSACNLLSGYLTLIGSMIHMAGPQLDPGTVEQALVANQYSRGGWAETGGDPSVYRIRFGPGDYNAISDFREVFWDPAKPSTIDGKAGAYVSINGGQRYSGGELNESFDIAAKPN
jgi:hypothetical protein